MTNKDVMQWIGYGDASWQTIKGIYSRYGVMIKNKMLHLQEGIYQGAGLARHIRENSIPSGAATIAKLHGTVATVKRILPLQGMSEEIAGLGMNGTTDAKVSVETPKIRVSEPVICLDNASLAAVINNETSKKSKGLRRVDRLVQYVKDLQTEELIFVQPIRGTEQQANPVSKLILSPTQYWKEAEYMQGTQPTITRMQEVVAEMGRRKIKATMQQRPVVYVSMEEDDQVEDINMQPVQESHVQENVIVEPIQKAKIRLGRGKGGMKKHTFWKKG